MDVGTNDDGASGRHARADDTSDTEDAAPASPAGTGPDHAGDRSTHEASHRAPDDPADEPADEPAEEPADQPAGQPADEPADGPSRRLLLAGGVGVGVVLAAGLGGGAALLWPAPSRPRPSSAPPAGLLAAIETEQALIADLDATTGGADSIRRGIAQARADHVAHLAVLRRTLARYDRAGTSASPTAATAVPAATAPRGTARTAAQLRAAEQDAARDAARRAADLDGALATLLASISACEATHVRLLA